MRKVIVRAPPRSSQWFPSGPLSPVRDADKASRTGAYILAGPAQ
ncbi:MULTISPECIES: hypothetical protein [Actinomyces]|nr:MULTISPECIES: hypothetical protein [Actinomyces]